MSRVSFYVDGFNLYFGLKSKGWRKYYWLDLVALSTSYLQAGQNLEAAHYFTSRIRDTGRNEPDRRRQNRYIDALAARGVIVHEGHYLEKVRRCRSCGTSWTDYEERMTDVNIATQLFTDAFDHAFDVASPQRRAYSSLRRRALTSAASAWRERPRIHGGLH